MDTPPPQHQGSDSPPEVGGGSATTSARVLLRAGGLGDVVMALAAAKAMKALTGDQIVLGTSKPYVDVARACPHVDHVITLENVAANELKAVELARRLGRLYQFSPVTFGLAREHQVDAYLWAAGLEAPAALKDVDLELPTEVSDSAAAKLRQAGVPDGCVVLHPADGDPNRTWPAERWTELAGRLHGLGHPLVLIGARSGDKGAFDLPDAPAVNLIGQLSALETVALLRRSAALVTTDSGALHLAAASDVAIVGIFSVVRGANRLPFRHGAAAWNCRAVEPPCMFFPCYRTLNRADVLIPLFENAKGDGSVVNQVFKQWCPELRARYSCLQRSIEVTTVIAALSELVRAPAASAATSAAVGLPDTCLSEI
jgi:ADP-heptose:LPS heptosyltransferase